MPRPLARPLARPRAARALRAALAGTLVGALALLAAVRAPSAQPTPAAGEGARPTLALVGGRVIDGYGGRPIEDGVVLVAGDRIVAVGPRATTPVPAGVDTISTEGMTVLPGLFDMHVHLMLLGHGDYRRWNALYGPRTATEVMPVAARQLLMAGVTSARDLGATPADILGVRRRIEQGEIPGPRLFVAGAFLQRAPYEEYERPFRWGIQGPEDARRKVRELVAAGVDVIKLIDQDQLTDAEVAAIVEEAHRARKPVIAHAHRMQEIRVGLKHGVDGFEHTGLGTAPGYPEDVLQQLRERNTALYWTPTLMPLSLLQYTGEIFPERLDDPAWRAGMAPAMADEIRRSLAHIPALPYYALFPSRIPLLAHKFRQLRETGVRLLIGTDAGIPATFHGDATWREMALWQEHGVRPMEILQAATLWPARALRVDDRLGTLAAGKLADVIAVRGDPLSDLRAMRDVAVVVKGGRRYR